MNPLLRRLLWRLLHPLPASRTLRSYETAVLEHTAAAITSADRRVLCEQIGQIDLVQRFHSDRMVTVYFADGERVPRLADQRPDNVLITLVATSGGRTSGRVAVVSHRGLVSSLEFTKSPRNWRDDVRLAETTRSTGPTLAADIDSLEHGAPPES